MVSIDGSRSRLRLFLLVLFASLSFGVAAAPGSALAAACVAPMGQPLGATSWTNPAGGDWDTAANWSNGTPSGQCTASITLAGTYTVTSAQGAYVAGLTLEGTTGTQTLQIAGSTSTGGAPQENLFRSDGDMSVGTHGVMQLSAVGGNPGGITTTGGGKIINTGLVETIVGSGAGNRDIQNSVINNAGGTIALHTGTNTCGCGNTHTWVNHGTISTDPGVTATFTGTAAGVLFTQPEGTFANNGRAEIGGGFTNTGGTTSGNPIEICGFLNAPGAGTSSFEFDSLPDINCGGGSAELTGDVGAATSVLVRANASNVLLSDSGPITSRGTVRFDGGPGQTQLNGGAFTNAGTLNLAAAAGAPSTHFTSVLTNNGTINVSAPSVDLASKFTQAGGTLNIGAGSTFSANNNMDLAGGTIANSGTFIEIGELVHTGGGTTGPPIELCGGGLKAGGPGTASFVIGRIANCSTMGIDGDIGAGDTVQVESAGAQNDVSANASFVNQGSLTVTSSPGHLVQLHNVGTITNGGALTLVGSTIGGGGLTNNGTLSIPNAPGVGTNTSALTQAGGTLTVDGSLGATSVAVTGGVLRGSGTVTSTVTNSGGTVHPGHSPGILTITGDYSQGAGGTLAVDIAGTTPGTGYSRLAVSGTAALAGAVAVTAAPPTTGTFRVLTAGTRTGTFSSIASPAEAFTTAYDGTGVELSGTASPAPPTNSTPPTNTTPPTNSTPHPAGPGASFTGSPTSLRVSKTGRFGYPFMATPAVSGKITFTSTKRVKIGSHKRKLSFAKAFTAPASGKVLVKLKLSRKYLKALKHAKQLSFNITVSLAAKTFTTKVTLKAPKKT